MPVVIAPEPAAAEPELANPPRRRAKQAPRRRAAAIEVDVAGVKVTIESGASPATIAAVIGAMKGTP